MTIQNSYIKLSSINWMKEFATAFLVISKMQTIKTCKDNNITYTFLRQTGWHRRRWIRPRRNVGARPIPFRLAVVTDSITANGTTRMLAVIRVHQHIRHSDGSQPLSYKCSISLVHFCPPCTNRRRNKFSHKIGVLFINGQ